MARLPSKTSDDVYFSQTGWVFGSFVVQALAGAVLMVWLAWHSGREALGVFNQLYALFVILGQLYVLGLNDSSLKHAAQHRDEPDVLRVLAQSSLICGLGTGAAGLLFSLILVAPIGRLADSDNVAAGLLYMSPAFLLFVINKILTGLLNGQQRMRYFAASQAFRAVVLVACIVSLSLWNRPLSWFGFAFLATEAAVLVMFAPVVIDVFSGTVSAAARRRWVARHLRFGVRSLPHGLLSETFFRVDILILAVFLSDADVGLYSFVAFFVEGVFQIPYVIRTVTTPRLVAVMAGRDWAGFLRQLRRAAPTSFALTASTSLLVVVLFPMFQDWFPLLADERGPALLNILLAGLVVYAVTAPFESLPLAAGRPVVQSAFMVAVVGVNVVLNLLLIPRYGLFGAAVATAISFCASAALLVGLMAWVFRIPAWRHGS